MRSKTLSFTALAVFLLYFAYSCVDQDYSFDKLSDEYVWEPSLATTIGSRTIELEKLINDLDSTIKPQIGADKFITIAYRKPIDTKYADSIIKLPNQENSLTLFDFPGTLPLPKTFDTTIRTYIDFQYSKDEELDSALISSMNITVSLNSTLNKSQTLTVIFPNIRKNGKDTMKMDQLTCTGAGSCAVSTSKSLSGYTLILDNNTPSKSQIIVDFKYTVTKPAGPQTITGKSEVLVNFTNLVYKKLYGYIGSYEILNDSSLDINTSFMDNPLTKNIQWWNPTIKVLLDNNYGVPMQIDIVKLTGIKPDGSASTVYFPSPPTTSYKKDIGYPIGFNTIGAIVYDSIVLDRSTSTIADLLSNNLSSIKAHIKANTNVAGKVKTNFMLDTSRIKATIDIAMPLWFRSSNLGTSDTMDLDMGSALGENNGIKKLLVRFNTENELPVDVKLKIYFTDENYKVLDSISSGTGKILTAGLINGVTGRTTASTTNIDLILDNEKASNFSNTKKAILKFEIQTANNEYVKFYADYKIKILASVMIQAKITNR